MTPLAAGAGPSGTVLDAATVDAVAGLVAALRQLEGLTAQVGAFALPAGTCPRSPAILTAICHELGLPLTVDVTDAGHRVDHAAVALAAEVRRAQDDPALDHLDAHDAATLARRCYDDESAGYEQHAITRPDGSVVGTLVAGPRDAPCVLVSPPPGLSHRLALPWLRALSPRYRCVIPQSRGTSGPIGDAEDFDRQGCAMPLQVADLLAVTEELADAADVHVLGLCGGSGLALSAAAQRPDRIRSVSLWHADLELGDEARKTDHQVNTRALVDLAGESRDTADWLRAKLVSGPMTGVPEHVGPLVVRPYATSELFYRYARLTAATVHWDCRPTARTLAQPCLVVASDDDTTTHSSGSRRFVELAPDGQLMLAEHGDHLSAFRADDDQVSCLEAFLRHA